MPNGVNVITGDTDSGKSALFRALTFLFENRPQGFAFKSWSAGPRDKTRVSVTTDMDDTVTRIKTTTKNQYTIETNGTETTYAAVGSTIPEEVRELLPTNISNFQPQHKPYFMLQDTPGAVGAAFAEVVGLEIIEHATRAAESKVRGLREDIEGTEHGIANLQLQLDIFRELPAMATVLENTRTIYQDTVNMRTAIAVLEQSLEQARQQQRNVEDVTARIDAIEAPLQAAIDALNDYVNAYDQGYLERAISDYKHHETLLTNVSLHIEALEPAYTAVQNILQQVEDMHQSIALLNGLIVNYFNLVTAIQDYNQRVSKTEHEMQAMIDLIGYCPLCGIARSIHETSTDGGLAHSSRQAAPPNRQLPTNAVGQNSVHSGNRARQRMSIHTSTRRHD